VVISVETHLGEKGAFTARSRPDFRIDGGSVSLDLRRRKSSRVKIRRATEVG